MERFLTRLNKTLRDPHLSITDWRVLVSLLIGWLGAAGLVDNVLEWKYWFEYGVMEHWRDFRNFVIDLIASMIGLKLPSIAFDYLVLSFSFFRVTGMYSILFFYWFRGAGLLWIPILVPLQILLVALCIFGWPILTSLLLYRAGLLIISGKLDELSQFSRVLATRIVSFCIAFLVFLFVCSDILREFRLT